MDSKLLMRAALFTSTTKHAANNAYNCSNGDTFRWCVTSCLAWSSVMVPSPTNLAAKMPLFMQLQSRCEPDSAALSQQDAWHMQGRPVAQNRGLLWERGGCALLSVKQVMVSASVCPVLLQPSQITAVNVEVYACVRRAAPEGAADDAHGPPQRHMARCTGTMHMSIVRQCSNTATPALVYAWMQCANGKHMSLITDRKNTS